MPSSSGRSPFASKRDVAPPPSLGRGVRVDGSLWHQLDRWVNEGGSQPADEAPEQRQVDEVPGPLRSPVVTRQQQRAELPLAIRAGQHERERLTALSRRFAQAMNPAVTASARGNAS